MNEIEAAELFNRDLDAFFAGEGRGSFGSDPEAMGTAAKFIGADFSAESKIRETLREKLASAGELKGSFDIKSLFRFKVYAPAALVAACLLVFILPMTRVAPPRTSAVPEKARGLDRAVETASLNRPVSAGKAVRMAAPAETSEGFFESIPMAELAAERLENFPIETSSGGSPIALVPGLASAGSAGGSKVVWETENAVFTLETREIAPEDIFERKTL